MTKPVLAIDIDDVLLLSEDSLRVNYNQTHNVQIKFEDMRDGILDALLEHGHERDQVVDRIERFILSQEFVSLEPLDEAIAAVKKLQEKYDLVVVTGRYSKQETDTFAWLQKHFPNVFSSIHLTGPQRWGDGFKVDKVPVLQSLGVVAIIDDGLRTCMGASEAGIKAFLFGDYPWNQADELPEGVTRVKDWDGALRELL